MDGCSLRLDKAGVQSGVSPLHLLQHERYNSVPSHGLLGGMRGMRGM
jgi:hypothetical protein